MKKEKYSITGMTCSACSSRVEKCVGKMEGMESVSVNLLTNTMQVNYDESKISDTDIVNEVTKAGYGASNSEVKIQDSSEKVELKSKNASEKKSIKTRLIWSIILLIPMMYISMCPMLHHMFNIPIPKIIQNIFYGDENALIFALSQFILLIPIAYLNRHYYIKGLKNLLHLSPNMDTLIAVGSGAAIVYGVVALFVIGYGLGHGNFELVDRYRSDLYFESAGMIVTLITLGKFFESKSKGKTSEAIEKLMDLTPKLATVERAGKLVEISAKDLEKGDILVIKPGERISADGVIADGKTSIDESYLTGESIPVEKKTGDRVIAATVNKNGLIKVRAEKVGEDTTINQIIKLVEEASASKAPIAKLADKVSGIFVPAVMLIAVLACVIWIICGASFEFALSIGIAVLVISCPCALGLATPVAIMVGTGKGAENGILIKSGESLEIAHSIDTVVLDKTGTVTVGKPKVTDVYPIGVNKNELIGFAAGIEIGSEHPLGEAIIEYANEQKIEIPKMQEFNSIFGKGIEAKYNNNIYFGGNEKLMLENNVSIESYKERINSLSSQGKTPMIFVMNQEILGIIAVADVEKETSKEAIDLFKQMNIDVVMLTGDNKRTAEAIKNRLNIPKVIAEVMPEEKEQHIARLQKEGHKVAMIGDGINDAPALSRADLGMAIGAGTDVAIESADIILVRNDLLDAVNAVRLSKSVIRNIKENLFWAFFYNTLCIPIAAGVLYAPFGIKLSPMFGAATMSLSSVCVVLNALRLKYFNSINAKNFSSEKTIKEEKNMKIELVIEGMMCEHCKKHVQEALVGIPTVQNVLVNLENKTAIVESTEKISKKILKNVIIEAGYTLVSVKTI